MDPASMAAARNPSKTAPPTPLRDGFHLVSNAPITDWTCQRHAIAESYGGGYTLKDITYHISYQDRCARIAFNRPQVLHAFRPTTIREVQMALEHASEQSPHVAVILLTSNINNNKQYTPAFCAGGDQSVRQHGGYQDGTELGGPKLRVLDLQISMRRCPLPILCQIRGYAIGGGHILHMCSDLTLCSENAVLGQSGPRMGSFDAGYGCTTAAACMGQKRARELWFLCRYYGPKEAKAMGLINDYFPDDVLDGETARWIRRMASMSPTALAGCKASLNAAQDGAAGISQMGGVITNLFYKTDEAKEGRDSFMGRRAPDFRSKL